MRNHPNTLMIFAAGFGTRMGALTKSRPKPMIEVAGKPLIDHALDLSTALALRKTVINTHYLSHMLERHLSDRNVTLINEAPEILETGGGLKNARKALGEGPCFTLNSDAVWSGANPLEALQLAWQPEKMDALLLLIPRENAIAYKGNGDFALAPDGRISRGEGFVYSGAQIIDPDLAAQEPERSFSLNKVWDKLLKDERIYGMKYHGQWCDVGSPEGIKEAEDMLSNGAV